MEEVHQYFADWITQVVRVYKGIPGVELEYTVGPIPITCVCSLFGLSLLVELYFIGNVGMVSEKKSLADSLPTLAQTKLGILIAMDEKCSGESKIS